MPAGFVVARAVDGFGHSIDFAIALRPATTTVKQDGGARMANFQAVLIGPGGGASEFWRNFTTWPYQFAERAPSESISDGFTGVAGLSPAVE